MMLLSGAFGAGANATITPRPRGATATSASTTAPNATFAGNPDPTSGPGRLAYDPMTGQMVTVHEPTGSTPVRPEKLTHPAEDDMGVVTSANGGGTGSAPGPAPPLAAASGLPGIDVSAYQGNLTWSSIAPRIDFVYAKATEGTYYTNPDFNNQYTGPYNAGLHRGAYHFAIPSNSSGATQARYFVSHGGGWAGEGLTLPGAVDIEYNPYGAECYGLTRAQMTSWVWSFVNEYAYLTGRYPVIYSPYAWWSTCTSNATGFASYDPFWIARYASTPGTLPAGYGFYTFWQYADAGSEPGDQDVFNGSQGSLQSLAAGTGQPAGAVQGYASLCLDNFRSSTANGNKIGLYTCNGTRAQHWTLKSKPASNGNYTGELVNSNGKCVNDAGYGGVGSKVILWGCVGTANELWTYLPTRKEYSVSYGGKTYCMNDPRSSTTPGVQQIVWSCTDSANEQYTLPH
jgi:GH25 family lysozyme M1 (1,4-beta-N-acetylmuramidase)